MLPRLKCQDGAVFSFFLFESYSSIKRLNCLFELFGLCAGWDS